MGEVTAPAFVLLPAWLLADSDLWLSWINPSVRIKSLACLLVLVIFLHCPPLPPDLNLPLPPEVKGPGLLSSERRNLALCVTHGRLSGYSRGLRASMQKGPGFDSCHDQRDNDAKRQQSLDPPYLPAEEKGLCGPSADPQALRNPALKVLACLIEYRTNTDLHPPTLGFASLLPRLPSCGSLACFCMHSSYTVNR